MITIVIANDSEQISRQFAMAVFYVGCRGRLVVFDAASSVDKWFCSFARAFECFLDVGIDDLGDDVNDGCASFKFTS